ncbi:inositol polyphosphate-4-phosphatase type I A isoform X1 [Rhodnius prolixus]|uniref:inositol polyphosphate-4-phosphatase type I A isoform X1 n=1 Tax=Rhodnius prolixus TaxID=13249 RepID=UPI003D18A168
MRFNKQELHTLATQPSQEFDKEGVLFLRERQEGFFRRTERRDSKRGKKSKGLRDLSCYSGAHKVSVERWCRLRGNLLFYFKNSDQWSEPIGVLVLEQYTIKVDPPGLDPPFGFTIAFEGGLDQHLGVNTVEERDSWLEAIQTVSYNKMRTKLIELQQKIEMKRGHDPDLDVHMWRLRRGNSVDPSELPICEVSLSCDNLLCDGHGRPPNPIVAAHVFIPSAAVWLKYSNTEVVQKSSNPSFLTTISFRASDGLNSESKIKFTAFDMKETVSHTATPMGSAYVTLSSLQENSRLRIPLKGNSSSTVGFLSIVVWSLEREDSNPSTESTPLRTVQHHDTSMYCHRRSQSLPPRLGTKLRLPKQGEFKQLFGNATLHTYRFHSGLGGDISVHEVMAESLLCFQFPQQLLGLWINEEKELLQEVAGMGELVEPWHSLQVELLDRHLHLLHLYSQAKENLQAHKGSSFKPSSRKMDRSLEFAPVNLHLQRMWVQNETLKKCDFYDIITVGAFTAHSHKSKNGGLIKLLQQVKESPMKARTGNPGLNKIAMAQDAIQAIKQLRREVVDAMRMLMKLAKEKKTAGMLPICDDMVNKTRTLLTLWDSSLVEEALSFVEAHKVNATPCDEEDVTSVQSMSSLSPFKRITQQLRFADLRSPDADDPVTPESPTSGSNNNFHPFWTIPTQRTRHSKSQQDQFVIFPDAEEDDVGLKVINYDYKTKEDAREGDKCKSESEEEDDEETNMVTLPLTAATNGHDSVAGRLFLDTDVMCSSPSANYYKPTDEPEPFDLTQLNIEASVMCLVSKVKFLCGRCSSPAIRIRSTQKGIGRSQSFRSELCAQQQETVTSQPITNNINKLQTRTNSDEGVNQAVESATAVRNKFTEGLELSSLTDWTRELRPSMKKLRQAMDGLLKTARLTHSVFRLQEDRRAAQRSCNVRYRRHVCFSHALTSLVTGLMAKLWCQKADPVFLHCLASIGPLVSFEALLSYYGDEIDMWGDMAVAVEDLRTVTFTLIQASPPSANNKGSSCTPRVMGPRSSLNVQLPVPDSVHSLLPLSTPPSYLSFHVTPVFFNIGINELATIAEDLGSTKPQQRSNVDNFYRLNEYYHRFRKLGLLNSGMLTSKAEISLNDLMNQLKCEVENPKSKNVNVLQLAGHICRKMRGLRFTSCKSAKDRTGMSVTLEQVSILSSEYDLAEHEFQRALDCMRSEGCRRENSYKNTGVRRYAFNSFQLYTLPKMYRPPPGTYGSAQT